MFAPTRYIEWARRYYGKVRYDLATSGVRPVPADAWGPPLDPAREGAEREEREDPGARLRAAIAHYNDRPENECVAALGTTHALFLALATLTSPGDVVLVEDPAYEPLLRAAEGVGAKVTRFRRTREANFALDPAEVARALAPRPRVIVLSNLHNPSGIRAADDTLLRVAELAAAEGAFLLVDEVYSPFDALVDERGVFPASARRLAPNVVAVSSLTKCYGLGNARLGWLLGPPEVISAANETMTATVGGLPTAHAEDGIRGFANIRQLADRQRPTLARKRARVAGWAASLGLTYSTPREGLFGFVTLPERGDLTAAIEAAAESHEVLVAAGSFFGIPNGFRIAWSAPADDLDEGLARLEDALALGRSRD